MICPHHVSHAVSLSLGALCVPASKERIDAAADVIKKLIYYRERYRGPEKFDDEDEYLRNSARTCRASKVSEAKVRDLSNLARTCRALRMSETETRT